MRLIDADALEKELKKDIMGGLNYRWYINNAPTVDVLEQIRQEIEALPRELPTDARNMVRRTRVLDIIDKYKGE